jgi:hypothetical protein
MAAKILWWRPTSAPPPTGSSAGRQFWSLRKQQWRIDCVLKGRSSDGWDVRVLLNDQWFFNCRFTSWDEAIRTVGSKYAELIAAGWLPIAAGAEESELTCSPAAPSESRVAWPDRQAVPATSA